VEDGLREVGIKRKYVNDEYKTHHFHRRMMACTSRRQPYVKPWLEALRTYLRSPLSEKCASNIGREEFAEQGYYCAAPHQA
jgi:hypothetical protein